MNRAALLSIFTLCLVIVAGCVQTRSDLSHKPQVDENTNQRKVRLATELAAGYFSRDQYAVALEEINNALKLDPNYAPAHNVAGLVYMQLKEDSRAESEFQRAVQLAPADGDIRNNFGWFLCQGNREKQAIEQFELAVRNPLYRTPEVAYINAGLCSSRIGEIKTASDYYRRALQLQPNSVPANLGLAEISYKAAQFDAARPYLRNALEHSPNPPADALYLGICLERKLNNRQSELSLMEQLRVRYPNSDEAARVASGGCE